MGALKGSAISGGLLTDEFLESAPNVLSPHRGSGSTKGAQQFFTPSAVADFIAAVLLGQPLATGNQPLAFDPTGAGSGNLLAPYAHRYGIEIDRDYAGASYNKIIGDCQVALDLATAIGLHCDLVVANPPFGLTWTWRGKSGRSARIAWQMIEEILSYCGHGAMIVPRTDYMAIRRSTDKIFACVEVPDLFGDRVEADCVIFFFSARAQGESFTSSGDVENLPSLVPQIQEFFSPDGSFEDPDFIKTFSALQQEFRDRQNDQGERRSSISVRGKKLYVYLSPFEQLRLAKAGQLHVLESVKGLHRQSIYQFWRDPREWKRLVKLAEEGDLHIAPEVHAAYEKVRSDDQVLLAPMMSGMTEAMRVAALRDCDQIVCIKNDRKRGFETGKTYDLASQTISIQEYGQRQVLVNKRDSRTGKILPEIKTIDTMTEAKAIRLTIGLEEFVIGREEDKATIRYLVEHFDLPEVKTIDQLHPTEFERWKQRLWTVIERLSA